MSEITNLKYKIKDICKDSKLDCLEKLNKIYGVVVK